jgi:growth hormone-inducible transmembrane protein
MAARTFDFFSAQTTSACAHACQNCTFDLLSKDERDTKTKHHIKRWIRWTLQSTRSNKACNNAGQQGTKSNRLFSTTPLVGQKPSPILSAPRLSPLKASHSTSSNYSSNVLLRPPFQTRGARMNPFQRSSSPSQTGHNATGQVNSSGGGVQGFSLGAMPHEAPSSDGPQSFSAPGGWQRALTSLGMIGGTALAAHLFFNRETRDGAMDAYSQNYLNSTFQYLAGGLTMVTAASVGLHRFGFSARLMATNPWLVLGVGLATSIGGMIGAQTLEPGSPGKYACWALFNVSQAAVLS